MAKAIALFSGGKDSALALFKASTQHDIVALASIMPATHESYMFHKPSPLLLEKQAEALSLPLYVRESKAVKEKELLDLLALLKELKEKYRADVLVAGGLASSYQGKRLKDIADKLGMALELPIWNYSTRKLWQELLDNSFEVIITKISCEGLPLQLLGRILTAEDVKNIFALAEKHGFRPDFEGGEAETAVLYMPLFNKRLRVSASIVRESENVGWLEIDEVKAIEVK